VQSSAVREKFNIFTRSGIKKESGIKLYLISQKNILIIDSKLCIIQFGGDNHDCIDGYAHGSIQQVQRSGRQDPENEEVR
jgi:hypothetical protein